jgi:hypothetical protein
LAVQPGTKPESTNVRIVIYYGDNIPDKPSVNPEQEQWRIFFEVAKWCGVL